MARLSVVGGADESATDRLAARIVADENRGLLRFLTCGSVDDGKSTLIGRLLYDSALVFEDQLQSVELILEKQRVPELEYIFKHALSQEAAYEGILLQERQEMHARVGRAIEKLMANRLDEFYGLLAYHFSSAEQWEKAQEYLFKAGDQAGRMAADAEAVAHYLQAMEAFSRVRGDDWVPFERAQLERKIGEAFFRLKERQVIARLLEEERGILSTGGGAFLSDENRQMITEKGLDPDA